jgi:hypothetical protein
LLRKWGMSAYAIRVVVNPMCGVLIEELREL